jgi:predicted MFS family arabinose efflux permease
MQPTPFSRTNRTWLAYLALGFYSYLLNGLGPALPYLRTDLHLSDAAGSLHTSAFAVGMLIAGLVGDGAIHLCGRRHVLFAGLGGMAAGTVLLAAGRSIGVTLSGALLMGALGTLILVLVPAVLADEHGEGRAVALSEANVVASGSSMLAPLLVGAMVGTALGWRTALLLSLLLLLPLARLLPGLTLPVMSRTTATKQAAGGLPPGYWAYWLVLVCCVSMEFCMIFWAADFLHLVAGVPKALASALVSVFLGAMLAGRTAGSRLARRIPADRLLLPALAIIGAGFPLYWLAPVTPLRIAGLFLTGAGIANLYPLVLSLAIGTAPTASDLASARAVLASATAIGIAPLILGWLADQTGIDRASAVMVALLVLTLLTSRLARRIAEAAAA